MTNDFKISRRNLLMLSAASGLMMALPAGKAMAQGATPKRGGHLVVASGGAATTDSLDPRSFRSSYTSVISGILYNGLVEVHGLGMELKPALAKSWEASADGKSWIFDLQEGVEFHDGKIMTSADVVYSLRRHAAEDSRSNVRSVMSALADIRPDGPNRVVIEMKEANYIFPAILSGFPLGIIPEGSNGLDGIGTGPYKVKRFAPGEVLEAVRHENYFRKDAAWVDSVEYLAVNDPSALNSAFQSGQINVATLLDERTAPLLSQMPNLKIYSNPGRGFICFNMRTDMAPFDNPNMRLALKLAIDREDMIRRVSPNVGALGNDHPVAPSDPVYSKDVEQHVYDPKRAKELYDSVGHVGPLVLQTSEAISSRAVDMAVIFQEHANKAGIPIEVKREPADGYWETIVGQTPFHVSARGDRPTADAILSVAYLSTSDNNECKWVNKEFDAAVLAARAEPDLEKRKAFYATAQRICSQDGGTIIPFISGTVDGTSADIDGFVPSAQQMAGYRAIENVWFV